MTYPPPDPSQEVLIRPGTQARVFAAVAVVAGVALAVFGSSTAGSDGSFRYLWLVAIAAITVVNVLPAVRPVVHGTADGRLLVRNRFRSHRCTREEVADVELPRRAGRSFVTGNPMNNALFLVLHDGTDVRLEVTAPLLGGGRATLEDQHGRLLAWLQR